MTTPNVNRFGWRLVLVQAIFGLVFAALTITGSIQGLSATKWTALSLLAIIGVIVGLRAVDRPFRHGLAAGFFAGIVAIYGQALFITTYFANNPEFADMEMPLGLTPRAATFLFGPVNAILAGLIAGTMAWLVWRVFRSNTAGRQG